MRLKLLLDNHSAEIKFIIKGNPNMKSLYVTERSKFETNKPKKNPQNVVSHYVKKQVQGQMMNWSQNENIKAREKTK